MERVQPTPTHSITLPPKGPGQTTETWDARSIVITGANGSGKSRLGYWIEEHNSSRKVRRIVAQRALTFPELVPPVAYEQANIQLQFGNFAPTFTEAVYEQNRIFWRWGGEPLTHVQSDYPTLLSLLFSDRAKRDREYVDDVESGRSPSSPPKCLLDTAKRIWTAILPHRTLVIENDRLSAMSPEGQQYSARTMSDGERVAFYLIGQILSAPDGCIVVIDEPEIHLHRSILASLWDEVEKTRTDCTFVYITHDLDFASSRIGARKIHTRSFDGIIWEWDEFSSLDPLPDHLTLQILGSRRPVLFVEGSSTSLDVAVYRALFPDWLIYPLGSCEQVIAAWRSMRKLATLHHLQISAVVDRDHRSEDEIKSLRNEGVLVTDVAEVENLFCIPPSVRTVAQHLDDPDPEKSVENARKGILSQLEQKLEQQVAGRVIARIQFQLKGFGPKARDANRESIRTELTKFMSHIDIEGMFAEETRLFNRVVDGGNYDEALRYFNNKGNLATVSQQLGITIARFRQVLIGRLQAPEGKQLANELRSRIMTR